MRPSLFWIIVIVVLAAVFVYLLAGTRPAAQGPDSPPATPPHAVVDE